MSSREVIISENVRRCGQCRWFRLREDAVASSRFGICTCNRTDAARRPGQLIPRCLSAAHDCPQFILSEHPLWIPEALKQQQFEF